MFKIILFKNNKKKKVLKTFKTEKKANDFFNKLIEISEKVKFREEFNSGYEIEYNLPFNKTAFSGAIKKALQEAIEEMK